MEIRISTNEKLTFHYGAIEPLGTLGSTSTDFRLTFHYGAIEPFLPA